MDVKKAATAVPIDAKLAERWSPYGFADRDVSDADLRALFEAARWAPSSYNEQPWRYIVARRRDRQAYERLLGCLVEGNQVWARQAPVLAIGVVVKTFRRNGKPNRAAEHDLGLASGNLCVEATARGLVVHQMIGIQPERVHETYGLPPEAEALTGLAIGYLGDGTALPEEIRSRDATPRTRFDVSEIVFEGAWKKAATFDR